MLVLFVSRNKGLKLIISSQPSFIAMKDASSHRQDLHSKIL